MASRAELNEVMASARAMRADNNRLEGRIEALEKQLALVQGRSVTPVAAAPKANEIPQLTVVKLKPKKEAAPRINTEVAVAEPSPDAVDALPEVEDTRAADDAVAFGDAAYERALKGLKTGNTEGSVIQLKAFAAENPRHPKADNALYFAGLGEMGLRDFDAALVSFEQVLKQYPASDTALEAQLKSAECKTHLNRADEAKAVYQHIVSNSPGTAAATVAQSRLATWSSAPAATR